MKRRSLIPLDLICGYFGIERELVLEFADFGLYATAENAGEVGIAAEELERVAKIISLHRALGINKEGIEIIVDLRKKISALQEELEAERLEVSRLRRRHEGEEPEALRALGLLIEIDG